MTAVRVSGPHGVVWVVRGQASPRRVVCSGKFLSVDKRRVDGFSSDFAA
jgi:hypothetical protein